MKLARAVVSGAAWNHAGRLAEYGLLYLTSILIARSLGVQRNGEYAALLSISSLILVFASMGLEAALNTYVPRLSGKTDGAGQIRHIVGRAFVVRSVAIVGAICIIIPFFFPSQLNAGTFTAGPAGLMVWLTMMRGLVAIPVIVLTALLRTPLTSTANVCARVCELAGILFLAQQGLTLENVFLLLSVVALLQLLLYAIVANDLWFGERTPFAVKPMLTFGGVFWLITLSDFFLGRYGDVMFLSRLLPDPSEASRYDVAYSLVQIGSMVFTAGLSGVSLAAFSHLMAEQNDRVKAYYASLVRIVSLLTIPLLIYLFCFARNIVGVLYGSQFSGAVPVLQTLAAFRLLARLFAGGENSDLLLVHGRVTTLLAISAAGAFVNVVLDIVLIPRWGAMGAAVAGGCALVIFNAGGYVVVRTLIRQNIQLRVWAVLFLPGLFLGLLLWILPLPGDIFSFVMKSLVFFVGTTVAYVLFKPLETSDGVWLEQYTSWPISLLRRFAGKM